MSREKQIEEIKDHIDSIYGCDCAYYGVDGLAIATELYNAGYRKQSEDATDIYVGNKSEWISVDERLPDINERCLLSMENRITKYRWVVIGYYHTNYDEYVTHWMPLPEAPK